ncbi:alpha/beta hydrolase-fold protein [Acinetobacter amyesii]|uniref:alpha/beta hydrolase-fold protein n=1 Tax=Acinetobacter amyesii TaxID=2942470 RepID=UPI0020BFE783|nr:alpha/beta hydrolase-fold protein [Acinetobacter amyesii]MCL6230975.1 alpha/beta hydrolase-fold protein [Acinetobacter amyesii]
MKELSPLFLACSISFAVTSAFAQTQNSPALTDTIEKKHFPYAAACEDVKAQSQILLNLQHQLNQNPKQHAQIIEDFWKRVELIGTPIIENYDEKHDRIIFLWKGAQHNVRLIGGPSNDHEWLTRLPNTDIWFKESIIDHRYIGSYSFAVDLPNLEGYLSNYCPHLNPKLKESRMQRRAVIQVQRIDPFNKNTYLASDDTSGLRNENLVALKDAPPFIDPKQYPNVNPPQLQEFALDSKILNNSRKIQIYQSKAKKNQSYITAIFFDGQQYNELLNVPKALNILVEQGQLPPIQAIFVSPPNDQERPKELTPNAKFSAFFSDELMPWIQKNAPAKVDSKKTVLLGSSLGGLSSAYLALENPNQISHVVPLSGSFWWQNAPTDLPNGMSKIIRDKTSQPKQHWFITANSYESSRNNNELSILETSPIVAADLKNKGHDVHYQSYIGGHSYAVWQVALQDALKHFFTQK